MPTQQINRPIPGVMVGLTHTKELTPIIKEPRVLRVGIGVPKGRACYIYTHQGRWQIRYGTWEKEKLVMVSAKNAAGETGFFSRAEAEDYYEKNKASFALSNRPQKIPFFTFTRRTIVTTSGKPEEVFEPDFAAIEAHGDTPREIDIVFMNGNPYSGEYQAWSATELKCHGDGLNALRVIELGSPEWPGWNEAKAANEKYFGVSECWASGLCPYMQDGGFDKLVCKPGVTLSFQLANSIRLGATAYFHTTSFRSINQIHSSLEIIKSMAERAGSGIANTPIKLVLAPFRTNHKGIAATQYGVSLEIRSEDVKKLHALLAESAWKPQSEQRMIAAPEEDTETPLSPQAVTAEFYSDGTPEFEEEEAPAPVATPAATTAATATQAKTEALAEKIKSKAEKKPPSAAPAPTPAVPPPAPTTADGRDLATVWRERIVKEANLLPVGDLTRILREVIGSPLIEDVTADNCKKVYDAVVKAKPVEPGPAPDGALF